MSLNLSTSCDSDREEILKIHQPSKPPLAAPAVFLSSTWITASKPITAALGFCWFRAHGKKLEKTTPCCCKNDFERIGIDFSKNRKLQGPTLHCSEPFSTSLS